MQNAHDLACAVSTADDTPLTLVERCAEAIAAREPEIGAFAHLDIEGARCTAATEGLAERPLRGLPVVLKDIIDTADMPTCHGSPIYAGWQPRTDAAITSMIRRAGGIIIGKAVTTPFAFLDPAETRNPCRPTHTPGGSSSGSAAAVAAGMVPLAIGTQTGGSVIRPASYCGVAAIKPSFRLLPTVGVKPMSWSLDTLGLFGASVTDIAFGLAAITGRNLRLPATDTAPPRLGLVRTHLWSQAAHDAQVALEKAAEACRRAGATVIEIETPEIFAAAYDAHTTIQDYEAARAMAWEYDHHRADLPPLVRRLLDGAQAVAPADYDAARRTARAARETLGESWRALDAVLTLAAPGEAPAGLGATGTSIFNRLWTLMGNPCVNVPGLTGASGLPIGIQVVGRFARDRGTLAAARFVEQAITGE